MKTLILGGSGILSTDVLKESISRGYEVTCVTRGKRDYRIPKGVNIIHGDVNNIDTFIECLETQYDVLLDFLSFDVDGLKYKLQYLSSFCKQYIFVSSATAYSFKDNIITENTKLGNEYWDYGNNKVKCEKFLRENYNKYGIEYTIVRPYITYGKTRIPFGIIPVSGEYWTLANRILNDKPILLWDDGDAKCTITNTKDFARGFVDLIGNERAFNEDFHITSDEILTWKEVILEISKKLNKRPIIFSDKTCEITKLLPEYEGVLNGDKARDRVFDNSKIKKIAPNFKEFIPFSKGIEETIQNYINNPVERTILYRWDGRIDRAITQLAKKNNIDIRRLNLKYVSGEKKKSIKNIIKYMEGRYPIIGYVDDKIIFCISLPKRSVRYFMKRLETRYKKK